MQRTLLSLTVATVLAPAAAVAQSTVEIYGRANLGIDNWRAKEASLASGSLASRNRIYDAGSRLGFRVNENLGGGTRAFVVMESGVNVDSGNQSGQSGGADVSTGFWASRDSYLGLGGGWGDVRWGRQSIFWSHGVIAQAGANYINTAADSLLAGGHGMVAIPAARQSNVLSYNSPTIGGFNASLSYSPSATEGSAFTGTGQTKDSVWGITGRYTSSGLRAQVDWAKRNNAASTAFQTGTATLATPATGVPENTALKLGLGWAYAADSQLSFIHERLQNKNVQFAIGNSALPGDDLRVNINLVNWEHMLGRVQLLAQLAWAGDVKGLSGASTSNTRVKGLTLATKYFMSKRTGTYISFNRVTNQANAFGDLSTGGYSSAGPAGLGVANEGADIRSIALGVMHNF
jgi:predicted porin